MIIGYRPDVTASVGISAWPSTLRVFCTGDSSMDNNNTGTLDSTSVSAGITVFYKALTEYSTTGTTTYPANSGLWANLAEDFLSQTGVTAVQMSMRAVSGSRFVTQKRDQITDAKQVWETQGWDAPHIAIQYGMVNDLSANGTLSNGEWQDGLPLTEYSVRRRLYDWAYRIRATAGWHNTRLIVILPAMEDSDYPQSSDLRTWLTDACATIGNCVAVNPYGTAVLLDDKHVDADHPTGGSPYISGLVMDASLV